MIRLTALVCGMLCGAGMIISGLFKPALFHGFVSHAGAWDISLGLGLLSALGVAAFVLAVTRRLSRPLLGGHDEPVAAEPTRKALAGGVLFGLGWGLSGYFPLAALVALGLYSPGAAIFLTAVLGGMILHDLFAGRGGPQSGRQRSWG